MAGKGTQSRHGSLSLRRRKKYFLSELLLNKLIYYYHKVGRNLQVKKKAIKYMQHL